MKRILTLCSLSLALCSNLQAQSLTKITQGKPLGEEPQYNVMSISRNGEYVCGSTFDYEMFIADWKKGIVYTVASDGDTGAELRHVSDNGIAIGFNEDLGVLFNASGEQTNLDAMPEGCKYFLGEDITADGTLKVGALIKSGGWSVLAAYTKDGKEWTYLPAPTDEQVGYEIDGMSSAKFVSGDGKIIVGYAGNFGPAILWYQNTDGTYTLDALCEKYFDVDGESGKPFTGFYANGISNNGKYVLMQVTDNNGGTRGGTSYPAVYNTETKDIKVYRNQEIDEANSGLTPTAIADDGTIIGYIGNPYERLGTFIIKGGEEQAKTFQSAFPALAEQLDIYDLTGFHTPVGISADGRYITGFGINIISMVDPDTQESVEVYPCDSYVIDTKAEATAVTTINADTNNRAPEYYSADGRKLNTLAKGLNIIKYGNGKTRKVIVR